ncbi:methylmalonyl-CoA mutase family protein [Candidatus Chloroploca asiatica]|uniref:Methylmalonyl-CoA mutase n=1 Tax=Candidatus Chloroploca asiatica TaxID=1506545 RepID=A0A2H3KKG5_9CHLR|nr:methylmalonyl-CoA mutase family protein [Candidatus Chloroploca asiatica]PDV98433.1 methylmalonyl-CoA mutase [Candidatus Chloroploca asiatica]
MTHDPAVTTPDSAHSEDPALFSEFPPTSYEAWRQAAEKTLKGVPFEKRLITKTYEGIDLRPLYVRADTAELPHIKALPGLPPYVRGTSPLGFTVKPWAIAQELPYGSPAEVNAAARADLPRGQTMLNLPLDQATLAGLTPAYASPDLVGKGGMSLASVEDVLTLLDGLDLASLPLLIAAGVHALPVTALIMAAAQRLGVAPEQVQGCIGMDPLGRMVATGGLPMPLHFAYDQMAALTAWAITDAPQLQTILVRLDPYSNGGSSAVQDLAYALATGVAYLRAMQDRGLSVDQVAPKMRFSFAIGGQFFMEIARLRAARLLWAQVIAAFGGGAEAQKMVLHARTATWTKTRTDAHANMLRVTSEAFAAVMGGCDSLHISPFDECIGLPDEFSRRIARNVHIILQQECNFMHLIDPAGGSSAVETLTDELARSAWAMFQAIEAEGGMAASLALGTPQDQVAQTRTERFKAVAQRKDVIVGTNMYPNLKERPLVVRTTDSVALQAERGAALHKMRATADATVRDQALQSLAQAVALRSDLVPATIAAADHGISLSEIATILCSVGPGPRFKAIPAHRASEQFEALRAAADAFAATSGQRPTIFLAKMGPVAQHKARTEFATAFFEPGGFAVVGDQAFETPEAAAEAALAAEAPVVVICSTDDTYPTIVPALTGAIKAARPSTTVILAGYPADQVDAYKQAGVDDFIHLRANCYAVLARLQQQQGVAL